MTEETDHQTPTNSPTRLPVSAGSEFRVRVTRLSVLPNKEPLFSEQCTNISIVDEAAGEFLEIEQQSGRTDVKSQTIQVTTEEWPALKEAIERLLADCETQNADGDGRREPAPSSQ